MSKWFWVILGLTVAALIGVFVFTSNDQSTKQASGDVKTITAQDHSEGNPDAKVTLIEYGDFQCPACGTTYPTIKKLREEYGNRVRFVFRHFPISSIHPNAFPSARAAEAAGVQGKFFDMHDLLYERQKDWSESTGAAEVFEGYAKELGLDLTKYKDSVNSGATSDRINSDLNSGKNAGVDGTPTFFLNGEKLEDVPRNYDQWKAKLEEILAKNP